MDKITNEQEVNELAKSLGFSQEDLDKPIMVDKVAGIIENQFATLSNDLTRKLSKNAATEVLKYIKQKGHESTI